MIRMKKRWDERFPEKATASKQNPRDHAKGMRRKKSNGRKQEGNKGKKRE